LKVFEEVGVVFANMKGLVIAQIELSGNDLPDWVRPYLFGTPSMLLFRASDKRHPLPLTLEDPSARDIVEFLLNSSPNALSQQFSLDSISNMASSEYDDVEFEGTDDLGQYRAEYESVSAEEMERRKALFAKGIWPPVEEESIHHLGDDEEPHHHHHYHHHHEDDQPQISSGYYHEDHDHDHEEFEWQESPKSFGFTAEDAPSSYFVRRKTREPSHHKLFYWGSRDPSVFLE